MHRMRGSLWTERTGIDHDERVQPALFALDKALHADLGRLERLGRRVGEGGGGQPSVCAAAQADGPRTHLRGQEVRAGLDALSVGKGHTHRDRRRDGREQVGNNVHLRDAVHLPGGGQGASAT